MDTAVIDISESSSPTASRRRVGRTIAISAAVAACLLAVLAVAHRSSREVREDAANTSIMGGFAKEGMLDLGEIVGKFGDTMGKFNTDPNFNFAEEGGVRRARAPHMPAHPRPRQPAPTLPPPPPSELERLDFRQGPKVGANGLGLGPRPCAEGPAPATHTFAGHGSCRGPGHKHDGLCQGGRVRPR